MKNHVASGTHVRAVVHFNKKVQQDRFTTKLIEDYFKQNPLAPGSHLLTDTLKTRVEVVERFSAGGVCPHALDQFRPWLNGTLGLDIPCRQTLIPQVLPIINKKEDTTLGREIYGKFVSSTFDSTARVGDVINNVLRYCTVDFEIVRRLSLFFTAKLSLNGDDTANVLLRHFLQDLQLHEKQLIAMQRDSCPTNGVCIRKVKPIFKVSVDVLCISHILSSAGGKISLPILDTFITGYVKLVGKSHKAYHIWCDIIGKAARRYSTIRWGARFEICEEFAENAASIPQFLKTLREHEVGDAAVATMEAAAGTGDKITVELAVELAAMLDIRRLFRAINILEGDGLESLQVYDRIQDLLAFGRSLGSPGGTPNLDAVLRNFTKIKAGVAIEKAWAAYGMCAATVLRSCGTVNSSLYPGQTARGFTIEYEDGTFEDLEVDEIQPLIIVKDHILRQPVIDGISTAFNYLNARVTGDCAANLSYQSNMQLWKAVRIFDPARAHELQVTTADIDILFAVLPSLGANIDQVQLAAMKADLPLYLRLASGFPATDRSDMHAYTKAVLTFWRTHRRELVDAWSTAARIVFAISPNSAASERVFSIMKRMFGKTSLRDSAYADMVAVTMKLAYNKRMEA